MEHLIGASAFSSSPGAQWSTPLAQFGGRTPIREQVERWPTPLAPDGKGMGGRSVSTQGGPDLPTAVQRLWPTPDASVFNDAQSVETYRTRNERERAKGYNGNGGGVPLAMAVRLWPTPTEGDSKSSGSRVGNPETEAHAGTSLTDATARIEGGVLNPDWVETLMGFPVGWTDGLPLPIRRRSRGSPRARSRGA